MSKEQSIFTLVYKGRTRTYGPHDFPDDESQNCIMCDCPPEGSDWFPPGVYPDGPCPSNCLDHEMEPGYSAQIPELSFLAGARIEELELQLKKTEDERDRYFDVLKQGYIEGQQKLHGLDPK